MKRLIMLAALSLAAVPLFVLSASAAGPVPFTASDVASATSQATTELVTASTTPKRDRTRPYTFTTVGKVVPPPSFCAPGVEPTSPTGSGNCVPIFCPPGVLAPAYCVQPPPTVICTGVVTVRFQKHGTTISARNVGLKPDCTYTSTVSFRRTKGKLSVRARFQGNVLLTPLNSATKIVRAG